ncbi:MAG: ABC transporter permease [Candidatus Acidiferrales bacterium]
MDKLWQDLRYGARQLTNQPGFTVIAVLTLALGIGANIAIFNTLDALLLKTLPVERPHELVQVLSGPRSSIFSNPLWEELRNRQDAFAGAFAWAPTAFNLALGGEVRNVPGLWASGEFFSTLGLRSHIGRLLTPEDDRRGGQNAVAVLGYAFWQREYGGSTDVLSREIHLDGHPFRIVGVTPPQFFGVDVGSRFDVAVPLGGEKIIQGENSALDKSQWWWLRVGGRLRPGVTAEQADAHLAVISPAIFEAVNRPSRAQYAQRTFKTAPAATGVSSLRGRYTQALWMLMGVVSLVLLIACGNIANLLLARAAVRQKEMGVRLALGASRRRLVRQLLTESVLLAAAGTALAVPLASAASRLLVRQINTSRSSAFLDLAPDWRMTAFVAGVALLTTVLFGLAPALRATRVSLAEAMKQAGSADGERRGRFGLGRALVVAQVAISMVLVAGAALLLRTFYNLALVESGFDADRVLIVELDLRRAATTTENRSAFYDQLVERIRALPAVAAASQSEITPISGSAMTTSIQVNGFVPQPGQDDTAYFNHVGPQYFGAMGTPFIDGRDFTQHDTPQSAPVVIVNEAFARRFFPGRNPVGQRYNKRIEIVGLVKDAKYETIREEPVPTAYFPVSQDESPGTDRNLLIRAAGSPTALMPAVRAAIEQFSPQTAIRMVTLRTQVADSLAQDRLLAIVSAFFGGLALLLSSVGLYGLLAHSVARRRREIGIRMALGSTPERILRMIVGDGLRLVVIGVVLGVFAAVAATRLLATFLFGVGARDPLTLAAVSVLLVGVTAAACAGAARRAARIEPWSALRTE